MHMSLLKSLSAPSTASKSESSFLDAPTSDSGLLPDLLPDPLQDDSGAFQGWNLYTLIDGYGLPTDSLDEATASVASLEFANYYQGEELPSGKVLLNSKVAERSKCPLVFDASGLDFYARQRYAQDFLQQSWRERQHQRPVDQPVTPLYCLVFFTPLTRTDVVALVRKNHLIVALNGQKIQMRHWDARVLQHLHRANAPFTYADIMQGYTGYVWYLDMRGDLLQQHIQLPLHSAGHVNHQHKSIILKQSQQTWLQDLGLLNRTLQRAIALGCKQQPASHPWHQGMPAVWSSLQRSLEAAHGAGLISPTDVTAFASHHWLLQSPLQHSTRIQECIQLAMPGTSHFNNLLNDITDEEWQAISQQARENALAHTQST